MSPVRIEPSRIERRVVVGKPIGWSDDVHPVLRRVYAARGVFGPGAAEHRLRRLAAPQLGGIDRACALLADTIAANRDIVVVGDFDCDGATATAVAVRGLRLLGARHVTYHVPNRVQHGYGLSPALVASLPAPAPELIVTVDNGIASHAGAAAARARGIRVLITDHHLPGATVPDADAIVNPKAVEKHGHASQLLDLGAHDPPANSILSNLAGVGVMFYVLLALRAHLHKSDCDLAPLLDLVALGTVADLVPLDYNNRILVAAGLKRMRSGRACAGVGALFDAAACDPLRATAGDLAFAIAPRINAAGRIEDMSIGIECLLSDDPVHAATLAERLSRINAERRVMQSAMVEQAEAAIEELNDVEAHGACGVVLYRADWHPGIVGLVASRLKERLHRPVIACAPASADGNELRASARSIRGFHIRDALAAIDARDPGLIDRFGGHAMAAGLTLALDNLDQFRMAFNGITAEHLAGELLEPVVTTDGELEAREFDIDLARTLRDAGPWGQGFAEPLFDNVFDVDSWRLVGEKHWRLRLRLAGCSTQENGAFDAILFNATVGTAPPSRVRAAYQLQVDEWNGRERLRLLLRYIEPA
ncbi:MAG: single-stranded-DNA-specific exonuclease RecJ [Rhodanobacteraceae bacterium]